MSAAELTTVESLAGLRSSPTMRLPSFAIISTRISVTSYYNVRIVMGSGFCGLTHLSNDRPPFRHGLTPHSAAGIIGSDRALPHWIQCRAAVPHEIVVDCIPLDG